MYFTVLILKYFTNYFSCILVVFYLSCILVCILLNVFYSVNLEIFYECFSLQVSSFFIKNNCYYAAIVILHFLLKQLDSSLSPHVAEIS